MIYLVRDFCGYTQKEAAMLLLKQGLFWEYGISGEVDITFHEKGKPYLKDYSDIFFNYSHHKSGVLCGIATQEIGVDIEGLIPYKERLAKRICHPREWDRLCEEEDKSAFLTKIWTVKESYLKYLGEGIRQDLRELDFSMCDNQMFRAKDCLFCVEQIDELVTAVCRKY